MDGKLLEGERRQEARVLASICHSMGLSPNRVLVIAANEMAKTDPAHAIEALRRLADAINLLHAEPQGNA